MFIDMEFIVIMFMRSYEVYVDIYIYRILVISS